MADVGAKSMDEHVSQLSYGMTEQPASDTFATNLTLFPVNLLKVLGEGGFSLVYLVQDEDSGVCCWSGMLILNWF